MALCRFFSTPSDRMSIIWSLMPIGDAVVLEYGPAGTTHFGGGLYSSFGLELGKTLYTTHVSEDDVVMGDVSRLEHAIEEIDESIGPKVIFVVASAVIAVIGTDIKGVCHYMQGRIKARLVCFQDGGFRGDYTYGLKAAYDLMDEEMMPACTEKDADTYAILGASAGAWRIRSDVWEIQQLMQEAFGLKCRLTVGLECTVDDLAAAGRASVNLVLRREALGMAENQQKKSGTPYVYGVPYGYAGTLKWLEKVSETVGRPIAPAVRARLQKKAMFMMPMGGPMGMRRTEAKAVLQGDYDMLLGLAEAVKEMDIPVEAMLCVHSMKDMPDADGRIKSLPDERDRIALYKTLHRTWLLGSVELETACPQDNSFLCVSAPFIGKEQIATHLPLAGERGMDYLRECREEYIMKCRL